jgi:hypothetical protein
MARTLHISLPADKLALDLSGAKTEIGVEVAPPPALRVEALNVAVALPRKFSEEQVQQLRAAVEQCPLRGALRPEVKVAISFATP